MLKSCSRFRAAGHGALLVAVLALSIAASAPCARAQVWQDFFQFWAGMGSGISAPIVNSYQQVPLSQALTLQPVPIRPAAPVSVNYVNPFPIPPSVAVNPPGTRPNVSCVNNVCQLTPPPMLQHNQQSYSSQQYYYPHGSTFSAPAGGPAPFRRR